MKLFRERRKCGEAETGQGTRFSSGWAGILDDQRVLVDRHGATRRAGLQAADAGGFWCPQSKLTGFDDILIFSKSNHPDGGPRDCRL